MSSILLIPAAASSLVLRDGLFVWLDMQWTTISAFHSSLPVSSKSGVKGQRAQAWEKEEKNLLLEIAERACKAIASVEKERVKEGKDLRGWVKQTEAFLKTVLSGKLPFSYERTELIIFQTQMTRNWRPHRTSFTVYPKFLSIPILLNFCRSL